MARKHYDGTPDSSEWVNPFLENGHPKTWTSIPSLGLARKQLKRAAQQAAEDGGIKKVTGNPTATMKSTTKKGRTTKINNIIPVKKKNSTKSSKNKKK